MTWVERIKVTIKALASIRPGSIGLMQELSRFDPAQLAALVRILERAELEPRVVDQYERLVKEYSSICERYHLWYYNTEVWRTTTFMGQHSMRSVGDLWNYQEILWQLKPRLAVEFGTNTGGGAYFFSRMLQLVRRDSKVFSVDVTLDRVPQLLKEDPHIELMESSSTDPMVFARIKELRREYTGPMFLILDSDHAKAHVLSELKGLRDITVSGDYVIVEDTNINGHPVLPGWGDGPYEALQEYVRQFPDDYVLDKERESKFGFSFATEGFLIRR